ncbi:hypothetical protein Tco_0308976 [Tanacetum coccineum]
MLCNDSGEVRDSVNTIIHLIIPPPLPAHPPVPPPRDTVAGRPALRVVILGGIIYTRENMGNVRSGNDTDADDANIRPIYDKEPLAEVQLTAECNIFAMGHQHTKQPEIINEGRVDQYPEQCQVKSYMLDSSTDNQTTDYSKQSLKWIPTVKLFDSCTSMDDSEPTLGSNVAFSDSDHAGCLDSRKNTSGGIQFLGGDKLVSWSSKKLDCTSMSSAKAEYVSLSMCCAQVLWLRNQLTDYGFYFDKIPMYCASKAAIAILCNPVQHSRTKNIDTEIELTLEQSQQGVCNDFLDKTMVLQPHSSEVGFIKQHVITQAFTKSIVQLKIIDSNLPTIKRAQKSNKESSIGEIVRLIITYVKQECNKYEHVGQEHKLIKEVKSR